MHMAATEIYTWLHTAVIMASSCLWHELDSLWWSSFIWLSLNFAFSHQNMIQHYIVQLTALTDNSFLTTEIDLCPHIHVHYQLSDSSQKLQP